MIRCNLNAFQNETFSIVGRMMATMIVQGGELPRLFCPSMCQYIQAGFDSVSPTIDEVPDGSIRNSLTKVQLGINTI